MNTFENYEQLYNCMAMSHNKRQMKIFGDAERWAFMKIANTDSKMAEMWLSKLEAVKWNNYLSEDEAKKITSQLVNQNGTTGAKLDYTSFSNIILKNGKELECEPYYNKYALWVTAMMLFSDHANSIAEDMGLPLSEIPTEKIMMSVYRKALEKLKDRDRVYFIREYYADTINE